MNRFPDAGACLSGVLPDVGHTDRVDAELTACDGCGVALLDPGKHAGLCPARISDERRAGEIIDAFLASVDTHAIDRAILDGSVDEPFNTATVIDHLRALLRGVAPTVAPPAEGDGD